MQGQAAGAKHRRECVFLLSGPGCQLSQAVPGAGLCPQRAVVPNACLPCFGAVLPCVLAGTAMPAACK